MQRIGWSMAALVFFIVVSYIPAVIGGMGMDPASRDWYDALAKPDWTPPGWVFGVVWGSLYLLMAVAAWLVWRSAEGPEEGIAHARLALGTFFVQLAVNAAWSPVFFELHSLNWAFIVLIVLWLLVLATTILFFRRSRLAGVLMLPYLAWVSFAGVLFYQIWQMNV